MSQTMKGGKGKGLTKAQYSFAQNLAGAVSKTVNPKNHGYAKRK